MNTYTEFITNKFLCVIHNSSIIHIFIDTLLMNQQNKMPFFDNFVFSLLYLWHQNDTKLGRLKKNVPRNCAYFITKIYDIDRLSSHGILTHMQCMPCKKPLTYFFLTAYLSRFFCNNPFIKCLVGRGRGREREKIKKESADFQNLPSSYHIILF